MDTKLRLRYAVRETVGLVVMGLALFWSAGRLDWWPAWGALTVMSGWIAATAVVIFRTNPELAAERLGPRRGSGGWDTVIMSSVGLVQLARYVVAGLDQRYGWTPGVPAAAQIAAMALCAFAYALFVWATAANRFFSQIYRIQVERGHTVVTAGPYRFARHPAYLGAILYEAAVPVLLASWWSLLLSTLNVFLIILRTVLEDRALRAELAGYEEYARHVRFRLLPCIW